MADNSSNPFMFWGTRVFTGRANGTIATCRLVSLNSNGKFIATASSTTRAVGVAPANYVDGDPMSYHRLGRARVETDNSAVVGEFLKPAGDGSGKAIKDTSYNFYTIGQVKSIDPTTYIAEVELFI